MLLDTVASSNFLNRTIPETEVATESASEKGNAYLCAIS
jgi:hypothetical protein